MESYDLDPVLLRSARVADALHRIALLFVGATVLLSPVFFASKEMWWFWPMVGLLSLGCLFCGAATLVESSFLHDQDSPVRRHRIPARMFGALALCAPMLAYAVLRAQFPSAPGFPLVDMDATRSVLLFWTPAALALVLTLSSRRRGRAILLRLVLLETFLLAAYGVWNHFHSRDMNVLWVVPNEFSDFTSAGRISATFFCPNHFSAWLDVAICLLLSIVAVGVLLIVRSSVVWDAFQQLLEEGDYDRANKAADKKYSAIAGCYWMAVTAGFLAWGFITGRWDRCWIVWPIAGVLFGALWGVLRSLQKKE